MKHSRYLIALLTVASFLLSMEGTGFGEEPNRTLPSVIGGGPLTLETVLDLVEKAHPLLQGSRTEKQVAKGKLLKALGAFEPNLVNDLEIERLVKDDETKSVGFNDTFLEIRHPWGIRGFAGFRVGLGDVQIADLAVDKTNQPLLGIFLPLLRGFITNPEYAELQRSELADQQANLEIQQTRQDLYLGAASQYWSWVAAWKLVELQNKSVVVAQARKKQLGKQSKAGAVAQFDVTEANQEVQRRLDNLINARRQAEQEQFKLSLFLWQGDTPVIPPAEVATDFPAPRLILAPDQIESDKQRAAERRPEVLLVELEAQRNNIDLDLTQNNLLPNLTADAEPTRKPGEFVLGLGYRFGVQFGFPFLQRGARGDVLQAQGKAQRLALLQRYRRQQVSLDVDNAQSAIERAWERIQVSQEALRLAQELEKGERTRFKLGATSLLFVNLRERNVVNAGVEWIHALADYQKALAFYQWATGSWLRDA